MMNSKKKTCPTCRINLHNHNNQQILECVEKQFSKQKETLARISGKGTAKEVSLVGGTNLG